MNKNKAFLVVLFGVVIIALNLNASSDKRALAVRRVCAKYKAVVDNHEQRLQNDPKYKQDYEAKEAKRKHILAQMRKGKK